MQEIASASWWRRFSAIILRNILKLARDYWHSPAEWNLSTFVMNFVDISHFAFHLHPPSNWKQSSFIVSTIHINIWKAVVNNVNTFTLWCSAQRASWRPGSGTAATSTLPTGRCWRPSLGSRGRGGRCRPGASGRTSSASTPGPSASCPASRGWTERVSRVLQSPLRASDILHIRLSSDLTSHKSHKGLATQPQHRDQMWGRWPLRNGAKLSDYSIVLAEWFLFFFIRLHVVCLSVCHFARWNDCP